MRSRQGGVFIGTSGWHYPHWRGTFYPNDLPASRWLEFYCNRLDTVEINRSFYRLPTRPVSAGWHDQTPDAFLFAVKAPRTITHLKKLKNASVPLERFTEALQGLGEKRGPLLFQLPPRWRVNPERLESFLELLPTDHRCAFEFRDPSWHTPEVYALLERHGAAFCIYHMAGFTSPLVSTADFVYIRLHGPGGPYAGRYHRPALRTWAGRIAGWRSEGKSVYCYFDNDERGYAVKNALELIRLLDEPGSSACLP